MQEQNQTMEFGAQGTEEQSTSARLDMREQGAAPEQETTNARRDANAETFNRAQVQKEIDRVAKKERERGRRQALRELEKEKNAEQAQQNVREDKTHEQSIDAKTEQDKTAQPQQEPWQDKQTEPTQQGDLMDPVSQLSGEEQRVLGAAQAQKTIAQGEQAVQEAIEALALKEEPLSPKEDELLFELFCHASMQACEDELTKRGLDGAAIMQDREFIEFAELMRGDVPLVTVYEHFARTKGQASKPPAMEKVPVQGTSGPAYFSQEQVQRMTRTQVRAHYNEIEKSRRFWK